jgi:phosphoribosyl-ATP pyrophosphohydrolase/phosphoribosyl-AMP cyclohydrolase
MAEVTVYAGEEVAPVRFDELALKLDAQGLIPCVVQQETTGEVLMVAWMNEEAFDHTVRTGRMTYYSRSRQELWVKGDTSGHYQ